MSKKLYEKRVSYLCGGKVRRKPQKETDRARITPVESSPYEKQLQDRYGNKYTSWEPRSYPYGDTFRFAYTIDHNNLVYCDTSTVSKIYSDGKTATLIYEVDMGWVTKHGGEEKFLGWVLGKQLPDDIGGYDPSEEQPPPYYLKKYSAFVLSGVISNKPVFDSKRILTEEDDRSPFKVTEDVTLDIPLKKEQVSSGWNRVVKAITNRLIHTDLTLWNGEKRIRKIILDQRALASECQVSTTAVSRYVNEMYKNRYLTRVAPFNEREHHHVTSPSFRLPS